jgi:DNA polymerase-3 subunit epsilon
VAAVSLTDAAFTRHTFLVIDFETLTPAGRRPEPIEVAAAAAQTRDGMLAEVDRFHALIRPPADVPLTPFDIAQTGITQRDLDQARPAADVMAALDRRLTRPPYRLVAHNAPHEAGLIADQSQHCPTLAATPLLDTVRIARAAYPHLSSYRLDTVLRHLQIPIPADRHRAMTDVELTLRLFARAVSDGAAAGRWATLHQLDAVAYLPPKPSRTADDPTRQPTLFDD